MVKHFGKILLSLSLLLPSAQIFASNTPNDIEGPDFSQDIDKPDLSQTDKEIPEIGQQDFDYLKEILKKELEERKRQQQLEQEKKQQGNADSRALSVDSSSYKTLDKDLAKEVLAQAPDEILNIIYALNTFILGKDTPKQLLLVGPPGTGKTTLAQAIARYTKRNFTFIHAPSLVNEYVHSGASNLRRLFKPILESSEPHILVIDEMTCLTDQHKNEKGDSLENATALWLLLDECRQKDNIFFIGITNDAKKMPAQLKSRFLGNVVEIPLPTLDVKRKIFTFLLKRNNVAFNLENNKKFIETFIKKTGDYSIREIESVISLAKRSAVRKPLRNNKLVLTPALLENARKQIEQQKNELLDFGAEQDTLTEKLHKESLGFSKKQARITLFFSIFGTSLSIATFAFSIYQWMHNPMYAKAA